MIKERVMRKNDLYEAVAEAIMDVRRRATDSFEPGTVPWSVADTVADEMSEAIGKALKARHKGGYPWKQSRWDEATGKRS